jgi:hypothetical protein
MQAVVIESLRGYAEGHLVKGLTTAQQRFAAVRDEALLDVLALWAQKL